MKLQTVLLFLIFMISKASGQAINKCNCGALIDIKYEKDVIVYDNPNGKPIKKLRNNIKEEDFLGLIIDADSLNFFHVNISNALTENNTIGWINKSKFIGTYARNYSSKEILNLYSNPDLKSKIYTSILDFTNQLFVVERCFEKWVYVKIRYKGQLKEGWLQPDKQCDNPYTTCN